MNLFSRGSSPFREMWKQALSYGMRPGSGPEQGLSRGRAQTGFSPRDLLALPRTSENVLTAKNVRIYGTIVNWEKNLTDVLERFSDRLQKDKHSK